MSPFNPIKLTLLALLIALASLARGQELTTQPTPFSAWLDFEQMQSPHVPRLALPIWLESLQVTKLPTGAPSPQKTIFRIRLRRFGGLNGHLHFRLFFDDNEGANPVVTGWSETGTPQYRSQPLGSGLNLATSEALVIPAENLDYLDVDVPGDGANVRGAFLATLKKTETLHALDFAPLEEAKDAFSNLPKAEPAENDSYLYGRVKATIAAETNKLSPKDADGLVWEFQLESSPLMAVVTFEILDVNPLHPPEMGVNDRPSGAVSVHLPDLADPAYSGTVRGQSSEVQFQYRGWVRAQQVIPGGVLRAGLNRLVLRVNGVSGPVAVRAVEIQLKHHWQSLDYKLIP